MKKKWKLCVMSGAIMVFAVLTTLILAQNVMSSADGKAMEFQLTEGQDEQRASGTAVSEAEATGEEDKKDDSDLVKGSQNPEEASSVITGFSKKKGTLGEQIVSYARAFQGVKYVYGGTNLPDLGSWTFLIEAREETGKDELDLYYYGGKQTWGDEYGVDASGFVKKVFEKFDIKMPRTVKDQAQQGTEVKVKDIRPGDIIFYGASNAEITHCGIYAGEDKVLHVSARTKVVKFSNMNYRRIAKVVRVVEE